MDFSWSDIKEDLLKLCFDFQDSLSHFDKVRNSFDLWMAASESKAFSPEELHEMKKQWLSHVDLDMERRKTIGERNFDLFGEVPSQWLTRSGGQERRSGVCIFCIIL